MIPWHLQNALQPMIRQGLGAVQMPSRTGTTIQTGRPALPNPAIAMAPQRMMREEGGEVRKPHGPRVKFHVGPIHSSVAGRTDHLPMHVASGSYVIPADIISSMGEGNTMAGFKHMRRMFGGLPRGAGAAPYGVAGGPYGEPIGRASGGAVRAAGIMFTDPQGKILLIKRAESDHRGEWAFPAGKLEKGETPEQAAKRETEEETGYRHAGKIAHFMNRKANGVDFDTYTADCKQFVPKLNAEHSAHKWVTPDEAERMELHPGVRDVIERRYRADGGATTDGEEGVPIVAAGGEYVLSPEQVRTVAGDGDLDLGHRVLDEWVKRMRANTVKTLSKLPGPKKD